MLASRAALVSRRHLRLRCSQCKVLLPAAHFPHYQGTPMHSLVCVSCKKMCVLCGVRQARENFYDDATDTCLRCSAKQEVAKTNVYFRYPTLKYKACPFSTDEMREQLQRERTATGNAQAPRR